MQLKEGNFAIITGGKNIGVKGKIVEIEKAEAKKRKNALVVVEDEKGKRFQTILDFVFSLGENQPLTYHQWRPLQLSEEAMIKKWEEQPMLQTPHRKSRC